MKFTIKQIDRCAAELQKLQNSKKHWPVKVNYEGACQVEWEAIEHLNYAGCANNRKKSLS